MPSAASLSRAPMMPPRNARSRPAFSAMIAVRWRRLTRCDNAAVGGLVNVSSVSRILFPAIDKIGNRRGKRLYDLRCPCGTRLGKVFIDLYAQSLECLDRGFGFGAL